MKYFCNGINLDGDYMGRVNYPRYVYFRCILQMSAFFGVFGAFFMNLMFLS